MGNFGIFVTLFLVTLATVLGGVLAGRYGEAVLSSLAVVCLLAIFASLIFNLVNLRESGPLIILVQVAGMAASGYMLWNHWSPRIGRRSSHSRLAGIPGWHRGSKQE